MTIKSIHLKEIEDMEHKVKMILRPLIMGQLKVFVRGLVDREDRLYPKMLQLIAFEVANIGRDLHDKDLI